MGTRDDGPESAETQEAKDSQEEAGRTIDDAVERALRRVGFSETSALPPPTAEPERPRREQPRRPEGRPPEGAPQGPLVERGVQTLQDIIRLMGLKADVTPRRGEEGATVLELSGADVALLIGRHGETLDALQLLTATVANRKSPETGRIVLDAEDYRARRQRMLENMARSYAEKTRETKKEAVISDLKAYERRIIHMALMNEPGVTTYSEGEGRDRKLIISPTD
jgi:spoIIIJ-associated protein